MGNAGQYSPPVLRFNGEKVQDNESGQTYQIPQSLADILFRELGTKPAQLRIMLVLCGTKPGFLITSGWLEKRTGISKNNMTAQKKALEDKGWITCKEYDSITVNFDAIYGKSKE